MENRANLLLLNEVAQELRRSVDGVRWLIKSQQLKGAKLGGRMVVRREDLDAFVEAAFADVAD